jgi:hypothetical protein
MSQRGIKLFGTEEPAPQQRRLVAGPVSATLENGALRWIKVGEAEAVRSIAFVVRDRNWSTPVPEIAKIKIDETGGGFQVTLDAVCHTIDGDLGFHVTYTGTPDGTIRCTGTAKTEREFRTCRTGFVILHPLTGVVGKRMKVEHVDGTTEEADIPEQIVADQPFFLVRAMSHAPLPGVTATIRMEGDSWETEDHRNWTDASFKTYCRPLSLPWPYSIPAGGEVNHTITLSFAGKLPAAPAKDGGPVTVKLGAEHGKMPRIGLSVLPEDAAAAKAAVPLVRQAGVQHLNCRIDLRAADWQKLVPAYRDLAQQSGCEAVIEVIIPGTAPPEAELKPLADALAQARLKPAVIMVTPAADLVSYPPSIPYPDGVPDWDAVAAGAKRAFPNQRIGSGMLSNFTELNRKRPKVGVFDYITHATSALVHAADDRSVMETLESIGHIIRATKAMIGNTPYRIGPSHIGNSFNPYGANYTENPDNQRVTMARVEPRHRGLFGAAWHLGYLSQAAKGGVEAATLASPVGEFGIAYARQKHAQPWYDSTGDAKVYPLFHVLRGLAAAAGKPHRDTTSSDTERLRCVAWQDGGATHLWLANLRDAPLEVTLEGFPKNAKLTQLDESSFENAVRDPVFGDKSTAFSGARLTLPPLATAALVFGA